MHKYPKVNYIGNKEKIADWIISELPVPEGVVLDLFSGGCSVAHALKKANFKVLTNDVLYSNYCISKAIVVNSEDKLDLDISNINLLDYFSTETYDHIKWMGNKIYFPDEIKELACLINYSNTLAENKKYIFLALLRRAMIRKIPYSRMNIKWEEIVKFRDEELSYQKYKRRRAYHNKTFLFHILDNLPEYNNAIFSNGHNQYAYQNDAIELIKSIKHKLDIIYIDPPYPSTMNKYKEFYGAFDLMFHKEITYTDFTNKTNFMDNLLSIVKAAQTKAKYVVISMNNKSNPSYRDIVNTMEQLVKNITIKKKDHVYKITGKENKQTNYEVLIIMEL